MTGQMIGGLVWERTALGPRAVHDFLLRLAGRMPDDELATMRTCLADGEGGEVARMLAGVVVKVPLLGDEIDIVRALFDRYRISVGEIERIDHLPPVPYRFTGGGDKDTHDAAAVEAGDRVVDSRRSGGCSGTSGVGAGSVSISGRRIPTRTSPS